MPSPVTEDTATSPAGGPRGRQVRLGVDLDQPRMLGASSGSPSQTSTSAASISCGAARRRSLRPHPRSRAAGGVGQQDRHAGERQRHLDMIARGARNVRDDRPVLANYRVDKAGFSGIRRACDDDPDAILQRLDARPREPLLKFRRPAPRNPLTAPDRRAIVLVIIDRALGPGGQAEQPRLPFLDLLPQPALGERQRRLALRFGLGLDQVGEPFRLGQVDAPVLERAAGEFARLGRPQAVDRRQRGEHRVDHRAAAMALKFNDYLRPSSSPGRRTAGPAPRRAVRRYADAAARAPPPFAAGGKCAGDALAGLVRIGPADPDDRDRRRRPAARQREDRVHAPQPKNGAITGATWCAPSQIIFSATHRMTSRPTQAIQR